MAHAAIDIDDDDGIEACLKRCEQELGGLPRGVVDGHRRRTWARQSPVGVFDATGS